MQQNELNELLTKAKELIKNEISPIAYDTWIKELEIQSFNGGNVVLICTTTFNRDSIEARYNPLIVNTFNYLTNKECSVSIISKEELAKKQEEGISTDIEINLPNAINPSLKQEFTFDTFVVGNNNRFAHAAALAVAESPGTSYNPLFIYGGSGLGKTHLMHAIGNEILRNNRNSNILYVIAEDFANQIINAIKDSKTEQFRTKYRNVDVLIIDDIQFLAGKERCQEEFFYTFEALHNNGKQIIISSDRPPKDLNLMEDRLVSRFEWGLLADIDKADYETRLAILRKKAKLKNIIIDDEILSNIANRIDTNIRELEGALNKLIARSKLINSPITMEMTEWAINEIVSSKDKVISSQFIQETVAKYFNIDPQDLVGPKKSNDIVFPRQIAMYLCRAVPQISLKQIGNDFGGRDHTTVMHACKKIEDEIKENKNTKMIVDSVKKILISQ